MLKIVSKVFYAFRMNINVFLLKTFFSKSVDVGHNVEDEKPLSQHKHN